MTSALLKPTTTSATAAHVIVIPGFLTEPITRKLQASPVEKGSGGGTLSELLNMLPLSFLDDLDPTKALDARAWVLEMRAAVDPQHSLECFEWASESLVELVVNSVGHLFELRRGAFKKMAPAALMKIAYELHNAWGRAEREADQSAERLYQHVEAHAQAHPEQPIYLIGHSLGARLTLRFAERLAERPIMAGGRAAEVHMSAWAPAINSDALAWEHLVSLPHPPEVLFSSHDLVLKHMFPLGAMSFSNIPLIDIPMLGAQLMKASKALGLTGQAPSSYPQARLINVSERSIGHLAYLDHASDLIAASPVLKPLDVIAEPTAPDPFLLTPKGERT